MKQTQSLHNKLCHCGRRAYLTRYSNRARLEAISPWLVRCKIEHPTNPQVLRRMRSAVARPVFPLVKREINRTYSTVVVISVSFKTHRPVCLGKYGCYHDNLQSLGRWSFCSLDSWQRLTPHEAAPHAAHCHSTQQLPAIRNEHASLPVDERWRFAANLAPP